MTVTETNAAPAKAPAAAREPLLDIRGLKTHFKTDDGFVREVLVGWRGVVDGDADLPFSETALRQVLLVPNAAAGIVLAFTEAHAGLIRKN